MSSDGLSVRPLDGILIATDIISKYEERIGKPISSPVPILGDGILETIKLVAQCDSIEVTCRQWHGKMCLGWVERYERDGHQTAKIYYSSSLNTCRSRFVICKEASHLVVGDNNHYTTDPLTLIDGLINDLPAGVDAEVDAEWAAMFTAMELLIPWKLRDWVLQMKRDGSSDYDIAYEFRVPERLISRWITPQMQSFLESAHEGLQNTDPA